MMNTKIDEANDMPLSNEDAIFVNQIIEDTASKPDNHLEKSLKYRILQTLALYLAFAGMGFCAPVLGLSIVHMEYILDSNTHTLAFAFTSHSIGYTVGGVICGIVYDRANKEFVFTLSVIMEAIMIIASGFCGHIAMFLVLMSFLGVAMGFIDTAGQSYCINLWANHRFKEPILQAAHAIWSLAATIGPFVIRPFLVELTSGIPQQNVLINLTESLNITCELEEICNSSLVEILSSVKPYTVLQENDKLLTDIELAQYAYLTIGLISFFSGILFYILYFYQCDPIVLKTIPKEPEGMSLKTKSQKQREKLLFMVFLFMLFMFYYLYIYIEGIPIAYFTAFVIKYLDWSVHHSTLVMALFYSTHCLGRVIGVPLSTVLRPSTMVIMNLVITSFAYILLLFVNSFDWIIWISALLSGFGMSSTFATMVLWVSETVPITGRVASVLLVGGSFGGMTGPLLVGYLFDAASPRWMIYILVVASLLHILLFALLFVFVDRQKNFFKNNLKLKEHEEVCLNNI